MSHPKTPPSLPTIVDEAGDSPTWVPALGLLLFVLLALAAAARIAMHDKAETTQSPAAAPEAEAAPAANP